MNEEFSINQNDYEIKEQIGIGSSSKVYYAIYYTKHSSSSSSSSNPNPNSNNPKEVSIKKIDLEKFQRNQIEELRRELLIMTLSKHENLLMIYTSFVYMNFLYIVTPYCQYGSMLDLMKYQYRQGFDENVCLCVLKQCLLGLEYLHKNSYIHRDVKSGNLLVERDGTVLLADFGVSSSLYDSEYYVTATTATAAEKKQLKRNTFVGTPCWIAPEVVQQIGYDQKADVWSFGITCLELTQGKAPFSKLPPMKVLLMTLQNDPPTLAQNDPNTNKKFSRHFKDVVDSCLQKDPSKRPTVEKLLQNSLFKNAKKKNYLYEQVLVHVPSVRERVQQLLVKEKDKDHKEGGGGGGDQKVMGKSFFKDKQDEEEDSKAAHDSKDMIASWDFGVEGSVPTFNDDDLLLESPKSSSNDDLSQQGKKKGRFVVVGEEKHEKDEHGGENVLPQYQQPPSSSTTTTTTQAFSPYSDGRSRSGSIVKENQKDTMPAIGLGLNTTAVAASSEVRKGRFVVGNNNAGILSAGGGGETSSSAPASANIPQQQQQPLLEEHIQTGSAIQSPAISLVDKLKNLVSADAKDSSTTTTSNAAAATGAPPLSSNSTTVTEAATRRGRFEVMSQQTSPTDNDASNTTTNTTASTATTSAVANTGTAIASSNQQQQQLLLISPTLRPERKDTAIKSISLPVSTYSSGAAAGGGGSSTTATTTATAAAAVSASRAITDDLQNVLSMCEQQTRIITDLVQKMKASDYYVRKLEEDNLNLREENERLKQRLLMK